MNATQNALVERCVPLAHKLARDTYNSSAYKFATRGFDVDDLAGEALFGLTKAARDFDSDRGVPFVNFAARYIKNELSNACGRKSAEHLYLSSGEFCDGGSLSSHLVSDDFEDQCCASMDAASALEEIVERVDGRKGNGDQNRREKYIYLITLLSMGLKQREYAEKMTERFGYCSQVTISRMLKTIQEQSEALLADEERRER